MNQQQDNETRYIPPQPRKSERGQAIVIMAASMVALLAILGLAVDGGGMFFLWRDLQNATDASALAAAYARCTVQPGASETDKRDSITSAALQAAAENGFSNDGTTNNVVVNWPPGGQAPSQVQGDMDYVEVRIDAEKPAYFIQIVYKEPLELDNSAIGFCVERFDPATVPAIMALGNSCTNQITFGNAGGYIEGGIFSNHNVQSGAAGQGFEIVGPADAVTGWDLPGGASHEFDSGYPQSGAEPVNNPVDHIATKHFTPPTGQYWLEAPETRRTYIPASSLGGNGRWDYSGHMSGLYYVEGDVKLGNNVTYDQVHGVTIVATGEIDFGIGNGKTIKHSQDISVGILALTEYGDGDCSGSDQIVIEFSGSVMDLTGVILAPNGGVNFSLSNSTLIGAIIADNVQLSGSQLEIIYTPSLLPPVEPNISMAD